jgi:predicted dehydrogenase
VVRSTGPPLDAVLADADVLVVATPNALHVPMARAGLEAGLAVVVDKPLAPTAAEARELVALGGRLTVFHNRRWDDDFLTLRQVLDEGALGELTRFESRFERFRPEVDAAAWRESGAPEVGGGVLLDLGPHLIDQAIVLLGEPVSVHGEVAARRPGAVTDDDAFVAIEHRGGAHSHLYMSAVAPLAGPRFRVSGLRAGFASDGLDPQEAQLRAGGRPGDPGFGERADTASVGGAPVALERGDYLAFYRAVPAWVRGDGPPPVDPADGVRVLEVVEAARR